MTIKSILFSSSFSWQAEEVRSAHLSPLLLKVSSLLDIVSVIYCAGTLLNDRSWVHAMRKGRPSLRGTGKRRWVELQTQHCVIKERRKRKPLCCEGSERASLSGCLYFFQCDFSLPPSQSVSASLGWGVCVLKGNPSGLSEVGVLQVR